MRDRRRLFRQVFVASEAVDRPANVANRADFFSGGQTAQDFEERAFSHPVNEEVALRVERDRAADFIAPIVVVREAAQRRFDAAGQDRDARKRLASALAVGERRAVGTFADFTARSVSVVVADFVIRRVMVQHRVHIPGANAERDARTSEAAEIDDVVPVRLAQNGDAEPVRFDNASEKTGGETRVVDVSVAGNKDDVDFVPTAFADFFGGHREGRRRLDVGAVGARGGVEQEGGGGCAHCNRYNRFIFSRLETLPKTLGRRRGDSNGRRRDEEEREAPRLRADGKFFLFSHIVAVYQAPPTEIFPLFRRFLSERGTNRR